MQHELEWDVVEGGNEHRTPNIEHRIEEIMNSLLHIQPFDPTQHDREGFDCGVAELNDYLARQANQDVYAG